MFCLSLVIEQSTLIYCHYDVFAPEYAPTSTSSFTVSTSDVYNQEVTKSLLIKTPLHKSVYDSLAEIYSILPTLEMVENSYLKDYITDKERYTSTTYRLIHQYQMLIKVFTDDQTKFQLLQKEFYQGYCRICLIFRFIIK